MKKILFLLLLALGAFGAAAADRAGEILAALADGFRAMGAYEVTFTVAAGDNSVTGDYAVDGERYRMTLADAEVFCDGEVRWEADNRRREVSVDKVDRESRNILDNPAHAFDFVGREYVPELLCERNGVAVVRLRPAAQGASPAGEVTVEVETASMHPRSLSYDYDGERVTVAVERIAPLSSPLGGFDAGKYAGYEFIDFR